MSKAVLISVRPEWCRAIIEGRKTVEVRKTKPKNKTPFKCYIYCTQQGSSAPKGYVIGEFTCDRIDNLMPACRMCNHYKRANSLETFRRYIAEIPRKLRENYIYKVGVAYGEVVEKAHPVKFYFEQQEAVKDG